MQGRSDYRNEGRNDGYRGQNFAQFGIPRGSNRGQRRGGRGRGTNRMVGQLLAQPTNLKAELASNFDFSDAGAKFDREHIKGELEKQLKGEASSVNVTVKAGYDKGASFFDDISCDAIERQHRADVRFDREKQREVDTETFGHAAANRVRADYMRYRRGGFNNRGGRKMFMNALGIGSR